MKYVKKKYSTIFGLSLEKRNMKIPTEKKTDLITVFD